MRQKKKGDANGTKRKNKTKQEEKKPLLQHTDKKIDPRSQTSYAYSKRTKERHQTKGRGKSKHNIYKFVCGNLKFVTLDGILLCNGRNKSKLYT
mmetsp:Transcript_25263/g.40187  ORF Transcript_25263/g.40187 Transcript_25263/m.40187 type:complete len:94 (-) Transcript_25263:1108-1389(-)